MLSGAGLALQAGPLTGPLNSAVIPTHQASRCGDMANATKNPGDFFYGAFAAVAMIGPILLVIAASKMPEGLEKGEFIVYGHGLLLAQNQGAGLAIFDVTDP